MVSAACLTFLSTIQHCWALTDIQQPLNFSQSQVKSNRDRNAVLASNTGTSHFSVNAFSCSCTDMNECEVELWLFKFTVSPPTCVHCFLFPVALLFMFFSSDFKQLDILLRSRNLLCPIFQQTSRRRSEIQLWVYHNNKATCYVELLH